MSNVSDDVNQHGKQKSKNSTSIIHSEAWPGPRWKRNDRIPLKIRKEKNLNPNVMRCFLLLIFISFIFFFPEKIYLAISNQISHIRSTYRNETAMFYKHFN